MRRHKVRKYAGLHLENALMLEAAVDDKASRGLRRVPTIFNEGVIDSGTQDSYTTNGMVAASCDDLHGASYRFRVSAKTSEICG